MPEEAASPITIPYGSNVVGKKNYHFYISFYAPMNHTLQT